MKEAESQVVLSNYPLSGDFRAQIEARLGGAARFVNAAELRQGPGAGILGRLLRIRAASLLIATEDSASQAMLPVLQLLAALTRARRLGFIDATLETRWFSRWVAIARALALTRESLLAGMDLVLSRAELKRLSRAQLSVPSAVPSGVVAYLNCNLWFGVKAGGSVGHISGVANALMDRGLDLRLFSAGGRLLVDERAQYVPLDPPRMLAMPFETTYYRFSRKCHALIRSHLQRTPVDFIYQRMSVGNFTGVQLSRELGIPLVLEYNGSEVWVAKNWGRALRFHDTGELTEDVNIRHAHLVVTVSDVLRDELLGRGVPPERIVTYPNCIDPGVFDPARFSAAESEQLRRGMGFSADDVVATFIGTFGQWHGVEVLARVIRRAIVERRDELDALHLKFLLVGDGQNMPRVRETLADVDAPQYVRITGLIPQQAAPGFLAASDLLLSPHVANADGTRFFGSPTKLFEYMAMSRGIIASDLEQIGEVLSPAVRFAGNHGALAAGDTRAVALLVPPGDEDQLLAAILWLARQGRARAALGANARRLALARYTWGHHVAAIINGLDRVQPRAAAPATVSRQ